MMRGVFLFPLRRKSKVRRSKSRYKMLEADEQDSLELQPPRAGKTQIGVLRSLIYKALTLKLGQQS